MWTRIYALLVLAVFYGCYLLKMWTQKKAGIRTDLLGRGKTGPVRRIELTTKCATYLALAAELTFLILSPTRLPIPLTVLGMLLCAAGDAVFVAAVLTMKDSWRAGVPEQAHSGLVTDGLFRVSRNPAFLGFDLVYAGLCLLLFHPALILVSLFAAVMLHLQIVWVEEPFLEKAFGEEYLRYRRRVCRYLGVKKA